MQDMLATLMDILEPHLPSRNDDRLIDDFGEVSGHTQYGKEDDVCSSNFDCGSDHLHGYLNRFLTEVDSGIYVGNISRAVCEKLWERIGEVPFNGNANIIYSDNTREQGFQ